MTVSTNCVPKSGLEMTGTLLTILLVSSGGSSGMGERGVVDRARFRLTGADDVDAGMVVAK